jgi:hypothetical protein
MMKIAMLLTPVRAFYSKTIYINAGREWKGVGFLYLATLVAACCLFITILSTISMMKWATQEAPDLLNQFPDITIINGSVQVNVPKPYYIKDTKADSILAIIDTTGTVATCSNFNGKALLTKNQVVMRYNKGETRTFDLSKVKKASITRQQLMKWLQWIKVGYLPAALVFLTLIYFIWRAILVCFYAALGILIAKMMKARLTYDALMRLSTLAITPIIIINTILTIAKVKLPNPGLISFIITILYLSFGIYSYNKGIPDKEPVGAKV